MPQRRNHGHEPVSSFRTVSLRPGRHLVLHRFGNLTAADRFIDQLVGKFQTLSTQLGIGRTRDELGESLRSFPVGNYVIFYRALSDGIEVVRVLSGFCDIPNVFAGD